MATRSTRKQPFCWQEKKILRLIQSNFKGSERVKHLGLYNALTWIDSDFNGQDIKYFTKTIHTYSGLSKEWIPKGLKWLSSHNVLRFDDVRSKGRYVRKNLVFTPDMVQEYPQNPVPRKPVNGETDNGKPVNGETGALEDSTYLEDNYLKEDSTYLEDKTGNEFPENSLFPDLENENRKFSPEEIKEFEDQERKKIAAAQKKEMEADAVWVVERFNELCGRSVSTAISGRGSRNVEMVIKLFKKGYSKEDIELMIVHKAYQWKNDPKMCIYLDTETLFGRQKSISYIETAIEMKKNPELVERFRMSNQQSGANVATGPQLEKMSNDLLNDIPGMGRFK